MNTNYMSNYIVQCQTEIETMVVSVVHKNHPPGLKSNNSKKI